MKRQQTVILKQQEKERRKQHLMMIRALESQRKAEVCVIMFFGSSYNILSILQDHSPFYEVMGNEGQGRDCSCIENCIMRVFLEYNASHSPKKLVGASW